MAGSALCSRGIGLSLMSSFTSGNVAGGADILKPRDKAAVTAASPLLFKSMCVHVCQKATRKSVCTSCGEALDSWGECLAALITVRRSL